MRSPANRQRSKRSEPIYYSVDKVPAYMNPFGNRRPLRPEVYPSARRIDQIRLPDLRPQSRSRSSPAQAPAPVNFALQSSPCCPLPTFDSRIGEMSYSERAHRMESQLSGRIRMWLDDCLSFAQAPRAPRFTKLGRQTCLLVASIHCKTSSLATKQD
jgi:hypothetical protein